MKRNAISLKVHTDSKEDLIEVEFYEPAPAPLLLHFKGKEADQMFGLSKGEAFRVLEFLVANLLPKMERERGN